MNHLSLKSALDSTFHWVIQNALPATVLIALVVIVQIVFRRSLPPRWRYALGLLILLRLALPAAPASSLSIFNLATRAEPPPVIRPVVPVPAPLPEIALAPPDFETVTTAAAPNPVLRAPVNARLNLLFLVEFAWLAGFVVLLAAAVWRHHRFAAMLRGWGTVAEPRANALLNECRVRLRVRRDVRLLSAEGLSTPALFGHWRPALLIPGEMLRRLGDRELRHIFLHELAHLKRGDILVNWAMIFVRALHWFNPVVWFAFRRLRADQELACDADVMTLLDAGERRSYGGTLIKVLEDFSASGLCPGLVPFVTRKPVIQRRITMIAQYKPAGRLVAAASFALLVALGCVTFTRAAGKQSAASTPSPTPTEAVPAYPAQVSQTAETAAFEAQMNKLEDEIHAKQMKLDELRLKFGITSSMADGGLVPQDSDTIAELNRLRRSAENEMIKTETQLKALKNLDSSRLRSTIPFIEPDPLLSSLLQDLSATEIKLVSFKATFGTNHPDVVRTVQVRDELNKQIDAHVDAVLAAMQVRIGALKEQSGAAREQLDRLKRDDLEQAKEYRPYWELKAETDRLQRLRDLLLLHAAQEKVDPRMPRPDPVGPAANIPPSVLQQYYDASKELDQARSEYQRLLRTDPQSSPLLQAPQARIKAAEDLLRQLEAAYPAIQSIPNSRMSSASPADVLVVNIQSDGSLRIDGSKNSLTADELTLAIKDGHPSAIEIRADSSAPFPAIVKVLDAAASAGVKRISIHRGFY